MPLRAPEGRVPTTWLAVIVPSKLLAPWARIEYGTAVSRCGGFKGANGPTPSLNQRRNSKLGTVKTDAGTGSMFGNVLSPIPTEKIPALTVTGTELVGSLPALLLPSLLQKVVQERLGGGAV